MTHICPNCGFDLDQPTETQTSSLLQDYRAEEQLVSETEKADSGEIKEAVPKVSGHRERFKNRALLADDVSTRPKTVPVMPDDGNLSKFGDLIVGDGVVQEV